MTKHQLRLLPAVVIVGLSSACGGKSPTAPSASLLTIFGYVYQAYPTDQTPIAGARVTIDTGPNAGLTTVADDSGRYTLSGVQGSTFALHASAAGYDNNSGSLVLAENRALDFRLTPIFRMTTDTITSTIPVCVAEATPLCFSFRFALHHSGSVTIRMTTGGPVQYVSMDLTDVNTKVPRSAFTGTLGQSVSYQLCTGCPPGLYEIHMFARLPSPVPISLAVDHPI